MSDEHESPRRRRRGSGRDRPARTSRSERKASGVPQRPFRHLRNPFRPLEILTEDQVEDIHLASLRLLEDLGLEFLSDEALDVLESHGAEVDRSTRIVRFDRGLVEERIAQAPSVFHVHARNPGRTLAFGDNHVNFTLVGSPPNVSDLDRGRRPGTFEDQCNLIKLQQALEAIHMGSMVPVEALDLPPETRYLDTCHAFLTLTDRVYAARAIGRHRIRDAIEMTCIARGVGRDRLLEEPSIITNINTNSPRRVDAELLAGLMEMAEHGQPNIVTPFTLCGAMSPVTLAGALAQQNAEALGVIAFAQMVRAGAPVVYGGFTSNVDMKSGAPAFGTPEYVRAQIAGGQLARRYRLPYRSSNVCAANAIDAQAAYESLMSIWGALMGGVNLLWHGAGWMEGGLVASYEKMVLDADMLQMMGDVLQPIEVSEETLALDAIRDVGVGGHFFGTAHTLARYETAFFAPMLSDWRNFEQWREAGAPETAQHANRVWKRLLADYEPPPMDAGRREALDAYMARRKEEISREAA